MIFWKRSLVKILPKKFENLHAKKSRIVKFLMIPKPTYYIMSHRFIKVHHTHFREQVFEQLERRNKTLQWWLRSIRQRCVMVCRTDGREGRTSSTALHVCADLWWWGTRCGPELLWRGVIPWAQGWWWSVSPPGPTPYRSPLHPRACSQSPPAAQKKKKHSSSAKLFNWSKV